MTNITRIDSKISVGMAAIHAERLVSVHCLFIPLQDELLLLPNSNVAEVVNYSEPQPFSDAPPWLLGRVSWRERLIPLISFEKISGRSKVPKIEKKSRIVVLNTLNGNNELPYIAIISQGIPQLKALDEKKVVDVEDQEGDERFSILRHVKVNDVELVIPDIDDIELRLIRLHE